MSTEQKQTTPTPAAKAQTPMQIFRGQLNSYEQHVAKLLADSGMKPSKFITIVENLVRKTPKLLQTDRASLFGAILTAAELGFEPSDVSGFCYIIPYGKEASFQLGYKGSKELMFKAGVKKLDSFVIYENDEFEREWDVEKNDMVIRKYVPAKTNKGKMIGTLTVAHMDGIEPKLLYMDMEELDSIKKHSKSPQTYSDAKDPMKWMYRKAGIKQISKLLPQSDAITAMMQKDTEHGGILVADPQTGEVIRKEGDTTVYSASKESADDIFAAAEEIRDDKGGGATPPTTAAEEPTPPSNTDLENEFDKASKEQAEDGDLFKGKK